MVYSAFLTGTEHPPGDRADAGWIEQGVAVDAELVQFLGVIATTATLPQKLRHKVQAIVRRQSEVHAF
jgi:hypothetical protein